MSGRARRVLVYTAGLLIAPMPVMPFVPGTREFAWSVIACGVILSAASFYVARGEMSRPHDLLGYKLMASSLMTLVFGLSMVLGAIVYLSRA
ncbi:MAG TPA: hypothetical protein VGV59_02670 [Pyrinomonadaceae bacterium]|nr:hypothetical protein [Pyrinomonadaceae bacterium]